jgi:hypothetical protein
MDIKPSLICVNLAKNIILEKYTLSVRGTYIEYARLCLQNENENFKIVFVKTKEEIENLSPLSNDGLVLILILLKIKYLHLNL